MAEDFDYLIDAAWLEEKFREHGRAAKKNQLATLLGIDPAAVSRMIAGERTIKQHEAIVIKAYFEELTAARAVGGEVREVRRVVPFGRGGALPPIEVRGTAAGSFAGAFRIERGAVDRLPRPDALTHATEVYALRIVGSSMEPEHRAGDLRLVDPTRPPRPGDSVVVRARYSPKQPVQAFLGHLLVATDRKVIIEKLAPKARMEFDAKFVEAIHKVLSMSEAFGR